jgi:hypothetical protein
MYQLFEGTLTTKGCLLVALGKILMAFIGCVATDDPASSALGTKDGCRVRYQHHSKSSAKGMLGKARPKSLTHIRIGGVAEVEHPGSCRKVRNGFQVPRDD